MLHAVHQICTRANPFCTITRNAAALNLVPVLGITNSCAQTYQARLQPLLNPIDCQLLWCSPTEGWLTVRQSRVTETLVEDTNQRKNRSAKCTCSCRQVGRAVFR